MIFLITLVLTAPVPNLIVAGGEGIGAGVTATVAGGLAAGGLIVPAAIVGTVSAGLGAGAAIEAVTPFKK
ncbi:hypothetical protein HDV06_007014 [Boothiomyces sp. JEL0866]|nr:hypothetical protein HDV06_007014 [Boothiomyces sp. JEL0866]